MDSRARDLIKMGDKEFSKRTSLMALWQEIALQFKPERADFFGSIADTALAEHLFTSYPVLAQRELGNVFAAMLRPRNVRWFSLHVADKQLDEQPDVRQYLEYLTEVQWRAMYDPDANFVRATKEADGDYVAFGQCVIQPELDLANATLLYRCHHLRDNAWTENYAGKIDTNFRKWKPTARQLERLFPDKISKEVRLALKTDPEQTFECLHISVPHRTYGDSDKPGKKFPFYSLYVERESETVLEETPSKRFGYVIPRWQTISGSQYARSPATEPSLPDARTMQVVIRALREAAEKHVDPPMIAVSEALRSDIFLQAGGVTYIEAEYDEKTGEVLRPVNTNPGTMPIGNEVALELRENIRNGMFLDKINLPQADLSKMPVYTVRRFLEEQIRAQAPLFEPVEQDYSAALCDDTFDLLQAAGTFGPADAMPDALKGADVNFTFQSPLRDIADAAKTQSFTDALQILGPAMQFDPSSSEIMDVAKGARDAVRGVGVPAEWLKNPKAVESAREQMAERQKMQEGAAALQQGAEVLKTGGEAARNLVEAGA